MWGRLQEDCCDSIQRSITIIVKLIIINTIRCMIIIHIIVVITTTTTTTTTTTYYYYYHHHHHHYYYYYYYYCYYYYYYNTIMAERLLEDRCESIQPSRWSRSAGLRWQTMASGNIL